MTPNWTTSRLLEGPSGPEPIRAPSLPAADADPVTALRDVLRSFGGRADRGDLGLIRGGDVRQGWEGHYHSESYRHGDVSVRFLVRTTGLLSVDEGHISLSFRQRQRTASNTPVDTGDPERLEWAEDRVNFDLSRAQYASALEALEAAGYRSALPKPATLQRPG